MLFKDREHAAGLLAQRLISYRGKNPLVSLSWAKCKMRFIESFAFAVMNSQSAILLPRPTF